MNAGSDPIDVQRDADDTGGCDQHLLRGATECPSYVLRHLPGVGETVFTSTGIGAAAVDDDCAPGALIDVEVLFRHEHGRSLSEVRGEQACHRRERVDGQHREIERVGVRFDAAVDGCRAETGRRGDAAFYRNDGGVLRRRDRVSHAAPPAGRTPAGRARASEPPRTVRSAGTGCTRGNS